MAKIRKGDLVEVITGQTQERGGDRGKQGRVLEVLRDRDRVLVEGINFVTKHSRVGQTQRGTKTGGIETLEAPIHISNVALVDPDTKQPARVGFEVKVAKDGTVTKERVFKPSRRAAQPVKAEKADKAEKAPAKKATTAKATTKKAAAADAPAEKDAE